MQAPRRQPFSTQQLPRSTCMATLTLQAKSQVCRQPVTTQCFSSEFQPLPDQKHWVVTGCRHTCDLACKVSVAMHVERGNCCVENGCRRGARITHKRAGHRSYRSRSSARIAGIEDQSVDVKERGSVRKIRLCATATDGPRARSGADACYRVIDARCSNHTNDASPANDRIVVIKCKYRSCAQ